MAKSEYQRSHKLYTEFSLGPLHWRSVSVQGTHEQAATNDVTRQPFVVRLQELVEQAKQEGCSMQEINSILSQQLTGDQHDPDA